MTKYAVAHMDFFNNILVCKIVEVEDNQSWKDALAKAMNLKDSSELEIDDFIETAKEDAFNQDWLFDVVKIN